MDNIAIKKVEQCTYNINTGEMTRKELKGKVLKQWIEKNISRGQTDDNTKNQN